MPVNHVRTIIIVTETDVSRCLLHNLLLVDVVGPPSAEVCRIIANFPQVDDLCFIDPWEA